MCDYNKLIQEIKDCHECERNLLKDGRKGITNREDRKEVNLWNYWQGDIQANIMVIGQDFGNPEKSFVGGKENIYKICEMQEHIPWLKNRENKPTIDKEKSWNRTDYNIYRLFKEALGVDVSETKKLFFTNIACCYRTGKYSGNDSLCDQWLATCANLHMGKLLRLIRPKAIIVLGQKAFEALKFCEQASLSCKMTDTVEMSEKPFSFASLMKFEYTLSFSDDPELAVRVFPVFHPGANSNMNRSWEEQVEDWKTIGKQLCNIDENILSEL